MNFLIGLLLVTSKNKYGGVKMNKKCILILVSIIVCSIFACGNNDEKGKRVEKLLLDNNAVTVIVFENSYRSYYLSNGKCISSTFSLEDMKCPILPEPLNDVSGIYIWFDRYYDTEFNEVVAGDDKNRIYLYASFDKDDYYYGMHMFIGYNASYGLSGEELGVIRWSDDEKGCAYSLDLETMGKKENDEFFCQGESVEIAKKGINAFESTLSDIGITTDDLRIYFDWFKNEYANTIKKSTLISSNILGPMGVKVYTHYDNDEYYYDADGNIVDASGEIVHLIDSDGVVEEHVAIMLDENSRIILGKKSPIMRIGFMVGVTRLEYSDDSLDGTYNKEFTTNNPTEYVLMNDGCYYVLSGTIEDVEFCSDFEDVDKVLESYKQLLEKTGMSSDDFLDYGYHNFYINGFSLLPKYGE